MHQINLDPLTPHDVADAERLLDRELAGRSQVRLGQLVDVLDLPGVVARHEGRLVGLATYAPDSDGGAELAVLAVDRRYRSRGVGTLLLDAVMSAAHDHGCRRVWLVTTNDNLVALGFYQRHGFRLTQLHPGSIEQARNLKPGIPLAGHRGIPIRDELVLTRDVGRGSTPTPRLDRPRGVRGDAGA